MTDTLYQTPMQSVLEFVKVVVIALIIAVIIRTFIVQPFVIPSGSMLDTLQIGDRLFVVKFSYGIHLPFISREILPIDEPQRGDIIVFPFPLNPDVDYIKRVVGVPGDTLEVRNKQLYRNGEAVQESYISHSDPAILMNRRDNMPPVTVPAGKVFVMGDNRDASEDSRMWGFVDKDTIAGRAWIIYWSSTNFVNIKWARIGKLIR
jgi:signal peptidase I